MIYEENEYKRSGGKHCRNSKRSKRYNKDRNISSSRGFKGWWKRRRGWQKALFVSSICVLSAVIIALGSLGGYFMSILSKIKRDDDFNAMDNEQLGFDQVIDKNIYNIALFGLDTRAVGDFSGNSDSIMILSLNKVDNTIKLISVMRDSLVPINSDGKRVYDKINSAYSRGDAALAVNTLNTVFGLDISEYATVNFFGMIDIIDQVGGIDATITNGEIHHGITINSHIMDECKHMGIDYSQYLIKKEGLQHLNGIQAVAYARVRYSKNWLGHSDDFGRTERQRYVMEQLLKKALAMDITSYPSLAAKLTPYVKTSFSNKELLSLATFLKNKPQMVNARVPSDEYIINADFKGTGASTVYYNYEYAAKVIHAFLYDNISPEDYMAQNPVDKTAWYGVKSTKKTTKNTAG